MKVFKSSHISESETSQSTVKRLKGSGVELREERKSLKMAELNLLWEEWERARFIGDTKKLVKLQQKIQSLKAEIFREDLRWTSEVNLAVEKLTKINTEYLEDFISEINQSLARLERAFGFEILEKIYDPRKDNYIFKISSNARQIDVCREKLIQAKTRIIGGKDSLCLREIFEIFDSAMKFPEKFEMEISEGSGELLRSYRDRREQGNDILKFEQKAQWYSINLQPGIFQPKK